MSRNHRSIEFECAREVRDDIRKDVEDLFPKLKIDLTLADLATEVVVAARIIGDTAPHEPEEVIECLGELGVKRVFHESQFREAA